MNVTPVLLKSADDCGQRLFNTEVACNDSKSEFWLQELLYRHPELLPVDGFDESCGPLIPVGRELQTERGPIDNLYVSPSGGIVIVETKLWKNPEKHRTVVAQIIDYAKELATWDYDRLANAVLACSRSRGEAQGLSLEEKVAPLLKAESVTLAEFQDSIVTTLSEANFLLVIVGDRISPNITLLTQAIHSAPGMRFMLGLVELRLFTTVPGQEWPLLVVPDIVGRTVEKTRGVVRVLYDKEKPKVAVEIDVPQPDDTDDEENIDRDLFLRQIPADLVETYRSRMEGWREIGGTFHITPKNIYWELRVAGEPYHLMSCSVNKLTVVREKILTEWGCDPSIYRQYVDALKQSDVATNTVSRGRMFIRHAKLPAKDLAVMLDAVISVGRRLQRKTES